MPINKRFKRQWAEYPKPATTPWGPPQSYMTYGPGIWSVTTASHGGIWLSEERNSSVPWHMRNRSGWYEEDVEYCIPMVVFPEEFRFEEKPERKDEAWASFKNNYPEDYEKFTGKVLEPGESRAKDEATWFEENKDRWIVVTAWADNFSFVPDGYVGVATMLGGYGRHPNGVGERRCYLIPKETYDELKTPYFVVLPEDHRFKEVTYPTAVDTADKPKDRKARAVPESKVRQFKVELMLTTDVTVFNLKDRDEWYKRLGLQKGEGLTVLSVDEY